VTNTFERDLGKRCTLPYVGPNRWELQVDSEISFSVVQESGLAPKLRIWQDLLNFLSLGKCRFLWFVTSRARNPDLSVMACVSLARRDHVSAIDNPPPHKYGSVVDVDNDEMLECE